MANLLDIRRRIKSVKNTQQITKAMKMVSAAKLKRASDRVVNARPFADPAEKARSATRDVIMDAIFDKDAYEHPSGWGKDKVGGAVLDTDGHGWAAAPPVGSFGRGPMSSPIDGDGTATGRSAGRSRTCCGRSR